LSMSQVHQALRRLTAAGLYVEVTQQVRRHDLVRFLVHGLPFVFPARPMHLTRGAPTAWVCPALSGTPLASIAKDDTPPIWPHAEGRTRGLAVEPLHHCVFQAMRDPKLYALLGLIDAIRIGRARERDMAEKELRSRLSDKPEIVTPDPEFDKIMSKVRSRDLPRKVDL
jgi:hypothetical protein